jgi:hypothetical protein
MGSENYPPGGLRQPVEGGIKKVIFYLVVVGRPFGGG